MTLDPEISEWDNPITWRVIIFTQGKEANGGNWNILVPPGEENNSDSPSSGERPGRSLNRVCSNAYAGL